MRYFLRKTRKDYYGEKGFCDHNGESKLSVYKAEYPFIVTFDEEAGVQNKTQISLNKEYSNEGDNYLDEGESVDKFLYTGSENFNACDGYTLEVEVFKDKEISEEQYLKFSETIKEYNRIKNL